MSSTSKGLASLRQDLLYLLSIASELEHSLTCQYLFAAFSLKRRPDEGLDLLQAEKTREWCGVLLGIARQEMEHLGLVCNLATALGGTPTLDRTNFPYGSRHFPSHLPFELLPFSVETLRLFVHYERPHGVEDEWTGASRGRDLQVNVAATTIQPVPFDFESVGDVYRTLQELVENAPFSDKDLYLGPRQYQIDNELLGSERRGYAGVNVSAVRDRATALAVIRQIREEGEGASLDSPSSHYQLFKQTLEEVQAEGPTFRPARPVARNPMVRGHSDTGGFTRVTDPFTCQAMDLFNTAYQLMLLMLYRFFTHRGESAEEMTFLKRMAFFPLMTQVIRPLGELLTELPLGPGHPHLTAGPSFEIERTAIAAVHHHSVWVVMRELFESLAERSRDLAAARPDLERLVLLSKNLGRLSMLADDLVERGLPC